MNVRSVMILACTAIVAGCAGTPPGGNTAQGADRGKLVGRDGKYSIREKDGVQVYCVENKAIGSNARFVEQCMSKQEWLEVNEATRREMRRVRRPDKQD